MANIVLISIYDRNAYGQRLMSANLKQLGHQCHMIFLKRYNTDWSYELELEIGEYPWMGVNERGKVFKYASNSHISPRELELLRDLLARLRPNVIGMTVNTPLRVQNVKVTESIKDHFDIPVVWGGYDPTVNAPQCLELCDYACVGEGDQTIIEIAERIDQGRSFDDVCNLAYKREGKTVFNPKAPAEQEIDKYPWRDNTPDNKYFIEDDQLVENYPVINDRGPGDYQTMSARGCPYKCTYCCEASLKDLYSGEKFLRRRSPQDIVAELVQAKNQFNLTHIRFEDEIFGMNLKWLTEFAPLYREQVGLPFDAYIYPSRDIENILKVLQYAGLTFCCLALESGSERINKKVFDRVYDRDLFLQTVRVCKNLSIPFYSDIITYNPYEEEEDLRKTLNVLLEMGGGFSMCINKLFVLPGTKMAQQMRIDGLAVSDPRKDSLFNYYCRLFWISSFSRHAPYFVWALDKIPIFRRRPQLLNPLMVKAVMNPSWASSRLKKQVSSLIKKTVRVGSPARKDIAPACR